MKHLIKYKPLGFSSSCTQKNFHDVVPLSIYMSNFHFEPVAKFNLISGKILLALPQMYSMINIQN